MFDLDNRPLKYCLLKYVFDDGIPVDIKVRKHGNAKRKDAPYARSSDTTMKNIRGNLLLGKTAPQTFDEMYEKEGGILGSVSMSDVPKDEKQIRNQKCTMGAPRDKDELFSLLQKSKTDGFIRVLKLTPEPLSIVYKERQLKLMKKFCTNSKKSSFLA